MLAARALRVRPFSTRATPAEGAFVLAVDAVDLRAGEVLAILGPNGAGKSTLLRALAGLERPELGHVDIGTRGAVAMVFQQPILLSGSVAWNAALPLWAAGVARDERRRRSEHALEQFGLSGLGARRATTLSGGEARRLALAQAFVREPAVLLLDEPFDDLDPQAQESLSVDLRAAIAASGVGVALVTHDLRQAMLLADRIAVLLAGRIVQIDARDTVLRRPVSTEVARLVGMANRLPGRIVAREPGGIALVEVGATQPLRAVSDLPIGASVVAGIRPEHLTLDVGRGDDSLLGTGVVSRALDDGALVTAWIDWGGHGLRTVAIAGRSLGRSLVPGRTVTLALRPEDVHLLPA